MLLILNFKKFMYLFICMFCFSLHSFYTSFLLLLLLFYLIKLIFFSSCTLFQLTHPFPLSSGFYSFFIYPSPSYPLFSSVLHFLLFSYLSPFSFLPFFLSTFLFLISSSFAFHPSPPPPPPFPPLPLLFLPRGVKNKMSGNSADSADCLGFFSPVNVAPLKTFIFSIYLTCNSAPASPFGHSLSA